MSENESDVQRERATDDRDNVVLTGEEIELPGDGSDAAAIIGETSDRVSCNRRPDGSRARSCAAQARH